MSYTNVWKQSTRTSPSTELLQVSTAVMIQPQERREWVYVTMSYKFADHLVAQKPTSSASMVWTHRFRSQHGKSPYIQQVNKPSKMSLHMMQIDGIMITKLFSINRNFSTPAGMSRHLWVAGMQRTQLPGTPAQLLVGPEPVGYHDQQSGHQNVAGISPRLGSGSTGPTCLYPLSTELLWEGNDQECINSGQSRNRQSGT